MCAHLQSCDHATYATTQRTWPLQTCLFLAHCVCLGSKDNSLCRPCSQESGFSTLRFRCSMETKEIANWLQDRKVGLPADPSRVGLPKWKAPNMAARAAIHLRGNYDVGDLLGEGTDAVDVSKWINFVHRYTTGYILVQYNVITIMYSCAQFHASGGNSVKFINAATESWTLHRMVGISSWIVFAKNGGFQVADKSLAILLLRSC